MALIIQGLNDLTIEELQECITITKSEFLEHLLIPCSGCISAIKDYLISQKEDQYVIIDEQIRLNIAPCSAKNIEKSVQTLISKNLIADQILKNMFRKTPINKKRCSLHTIRAATVINIQGVVEEFCNQMSEKFENCIILESEFTEHLNNYLKTKKFCPSCKENILNAYNYLKSQSVQAECSCSILCFIKFNQETKQIQIPYDAILINALLKKAQCQPFYQHASTKEDAQDELLICLSLLLQEKLTTIWKEKQTQDYINNVFYYWLGEAFKSRIQHYINLKQEKMGQLNELDKYLLQESEQKQKLKKKRQQRKLKKKRQGSSDSSSTRTNYRLGQSDRTLSPSHSEKRLLKAFGWQKSPSVSPQTKNELELLKQQHLIEINQRRQLLRLQTKQCWCEWCSSQKK